MYRVSVSLLLLASLTAEESAPAVAAASSVPLPADPGFTYRGYWMDRSGLYRCGCRDYDPTTGRFIEPDPAHAGMNWYVYCGGNPVCREDPSGLDWRWTFNGITPQHGQWDYVPGSNPHVPHPRWTPEQMDGIDFVDAATYRAIKGASGASLGSLGPFDSPYPYLPTGTDLGENYAGFSGNGAYTPASVAMLGEIAANQALEEEMLRDVAEADHIDAINEMNRQRRAMEQAQMLARYEAVNAAALMPGRMVMEPAAQLRDIAMLSSGGAFGEPWSMTAATARAHMAAGHSAAYASSVGTAWAVAELATLRAGTVVRGARAAWQTVGETSYTINTIPYAGRLSALNALGLRRKVLSDIQVINFAAPGSAMWANTQAHEGFHAWVAGRVPWISIAGDTRWLGVPFGAPVKYLEETAAYGVGHAAEGAYMRSILAPFHAFRSLTPGEGGVVLGVGAAGAYDLFGDP